MRRSTQSRRILRNRGKRPTSSRTQPIRASSKVVGSSNGQASPGRASSGRARARRGDGVLSRWQALKTCPWRPISIPTPGAFNSTPPALLRAGLRASHPGVPPTLDGNSLSIAVGGFDTFLLADRSGAFLPAHAISLGLEIIVAVAINVAATATALTIILTIILVERPLKRA
jgi:hypothetical protein